VLACFFSPAFLVFSLLFRLNGLRSRFDYDVPEHIVRLKRTQTDKSLVPLEEAYGCGCNSRSSKPAGGIFDVAGVFDSHTLPPYLVSCYQCVPS
jgi:hypothetical protein